MKVTALILADNAQVVPPEGKLFIMGGGFDRVAASHFPTTLRSLTVAAQAELSEGDANVPHTARVTVQGPSGRDVIEPKMVQFAHQGQISRSEFPLSLNFVLKIDNLTLSEPGRHRVTVYADDDSAGVSASFTVTATGDGADSRLQAGYLAFQQGDYNSAEAIFRSVTEEFPGHAAAFNNLAFVQLERRDVANAELNFRKAQDLGYPQPELLVINQACAAYLAGRAPEALKLLQRVTDLVRLSVVAILFVLDGDDLFPVNVTSQEHYQDLVALNSAWAALRTGDRGLAKEYLQRGSTAPWEDQPHFGRALENAQALVRG